MSSCLWILMDRVMNLTASETELEKKTKNVNQQVRNAMCSQSVTSPSPRCSSMKPEKLVLLVLNMDFWSLDLVGSYVWPVGRSPVIAATSKSVGVTIPQGIWKVFVEDSQKWIEAKSMAWLYLMGFLKI